METTKRTMTHWLTLQADETSTQSDDRGLMLIRHPANNDVVELHVHRTYLAAPKLVEILRKIVTNYVTSGPDAVKRFNAAIDQGNAALAQIEGD